MTILVTGATGQVGRELVQLLAESGRRVRALTRTPERAALAVGVEVVRGDLEQPATLTAALEGVERMYLFPVPRTAPEVVARAVRAGVRRVVVLSGAGAAEESDDETGEEPDGYRAVERPVERSGLEWTHVRPGEFATNWLDHAPEIRAERVVRLPFGDAVTQPTHEADIAAVAAAALLEDGHAGATYTFAGPEALTKVEQVRAIGAAIGREIRFEELTPEQAREKWLDPEQGVDEATVDWLLDLYGGAVGGSWQVPPDGTVERVLGRPPRSFARWAADHAADFR